MIIKLQINLEINLGQKKKKKKNLFLEMQVKRKIFIRAVAKLFF